MNTTKKDLATAVAQRVGVTQEVAQTVIEEALKEIIEKTSPHDDVIIREFGRFFLKFRKAKKGRNLVKNYEVEIPAHYVVAFKPSASWADGVRSM